MWEVDPIIFGALTEYFHHMVSTDKASMTEAPSASASVASSASASAAPSASASAAASVAPSASVILDSVVSMDVTLAFATSDSTKDASVTFKASTVEDSILEPTTVNKSLNKSTMDMSVVVKASTVEPSQLKAASSLSVKAATIKPIMDVAARVGASMVNASPKAVNGILITVV